MSTLVIVESPAKAKTIAGYLGKSYQVEASFGHVRDLPQSASDVPAELKKQKWSKLGVNVDGDFEPLYIVPEEKKQRVSALRAAAKGKDELLLATDEDREGESISWHILQLLKPGKGIRVKRIVFHEITPEAIKAAIGSPRDIDESLVRAQEARRIVDRLYGYTLSPLLWKKVAPRLSAGRVQSVAVRLLVDRERERRAFKSASYWDLEATLSGDGGTAFKARLSRVSGKRVASGKSFDSTTGALADQDVAVLDEARATELGARAEKSAPWRVAELETRPEQEKPPVPFMTSTLQQEANRKLRFSAKRTMQIAQQLYEGTDLDGERTGLITYMRTDSLTLSERALSQCRELIERNYGPEYLPKEPVRHRTKSKNAQEAHEAIRPTDLTRRPEDLRRWLDPDQLKLYELIWKRTVACQMVPARVLRTSAQIEVVAGSDTLRFSASGRQIEFPGFLRAYVEGSDDPDSEIEGQESLLPPLTQGREVRAQQVAAQGHATKPPARLTEATLVKKLEEAGIGRPSTYASILGTIVDRGYVWKRGNELVPTFTAFAVTDLLEQHFGKLVDLKFTARMEDELDEIADGGRDSIGYLASFYRGEQGETGLAQQVENKTEEIPFPAIPIGNDPESNEPVVVRVGRFGTYVQRGPGGAGNTASIPDDVPPADLTVEAALAAIKKKSSGPVVVGKDPQTGRDVTLRSGRFGTYLEVAQTEAEIAAEEKPRRTSLPDDIDQAAVSQADVDALLSLPRTVGAHPETKEDIVVALGRYGAFLRCGKETRNVERWRDGVTMGLEAALALLAQPKLRGRRGQQAAVRTPFREFGALEGAAGPVNIFEGKYGIYASDGTTNATLPKGTDPKEITADEVMGFLRVRMAAAPKSKRGKPGRGGAGAKKAAAPKKAAAKKAEQAETSKADDAKKPAKKAAKKAAKKPAAKKD